jgi:DNA-binding NtrC family response regulator
MFFENEGCGDVMLSSTYREANNMSSTPKYVWMVIIDDQPRSLEYLSAALARDGLKILTAANPQEGLELVYEHRPQIVLSDVVMPEMSGLDVLEQVKKFEPSTDVVLMSAGNDPAVLAAEASRKGAAGFLRKPISLAVLRKHLGRLIDIHLRASGTDHPS